MATTNVRFSSRSHAGLLVTLCALWVAAAPASSRGQALDGHAQNSRQQQEPAPPSPTPPSRSFVLIVTVVGQGESAELPLHGATVTVFAPDHEERHGTDTSGKATFRFTTTAKAFILRVVADEWQPHQQQLEIDGTEKSLKVLLKPSD